MITLRFATIERTDFGCVTRFRDGSYVNSIPHPNDQHYHVIAHRCGYGDDLHAYCFEHDFAHSFVSEHFWNGWSPVLYCLAHPGCEMTRGTATIEEIAVQTFQRFMRANEWPIVGGIDWGALKLEALALLDGEHE